MNKKNSLATRPLGGALLWICLYGAIAAVLPAVVQILILGSTKRYGLLSAFGWGFIFVLGPCLMIGALLGVVGWCVWWLIRRYLPGQSVFARAGAVGAIAGACGALPVGSLLASTELQLVPSWVVPLTGAYLGLMFGGFVVRWERREAHERRALVDRIGRA